MSLSNMRTRRGYADRFPAVSPHFSSISPRPIITAMLKIKRSDDNEKNNTRTLLTRERPIFKQLRRRGHDQPTNPKISPSCTDLINCSINFWRFIANAEAILRLRPSPDRRVVQEIEFSSNRVIHAHAIVEKKIYNINKQIANVITDRERRLPRRVTSSVCNVGPINRNIWKLGEGIYFI